MSRQEDRVEGESELLGQLAPGLARELHRPVQELADSLHFIDDAFGDVLELVEKYRRVLEVGAAPPKDDVLRQAEAYVDLEHLRRHVPQALERCVEGINEVVRTLRALSELNPPCSSEVRPADVNRGLESVVRAARSEYKYVADLDLDLGELPLLPCRSAQLNLAFLHLIVHAGRAIADRVGDSGDRGRIRVSTQRRGDRVVVSIEHDGRLLPTAIVEQQLVVAQDIVAGRHDGRLVIEHEEGHGTRLQVQLPLQGSSRSARPELAVVSV
ncbi:MAG: ATP-binding protein [Acidobacteriota bacterium]